MITKEQAIEILNGDFSKVILGENESHSELFTEAFNMAVEALNGKDTNVPSEWIPCSERLPETYGEYLCCDRCGNIILAMPFKESDSDTGYCAETEGCYMWSCTAWMYLPASFEESED